MSFLRCLCSYISEIVENPHPGGFENFVLPQMPKKAPNCTELDCVILKTVRKANEWLSLKE